MYQEVGFKPTQWSIDNKLAASSITLVFCVLAYLVKCAWNEVGPNFIALLSTQFAKHEISFLIKIRIINQISTCCLLLVTGIQLLFAYLENHVEIWLVILFLLWQKIHGKQICVLSSSMKLGPGERHIQS